ncbi:MAG: Ig-like domain-containing protein, partial [Desulfomonilia bacterium]
FAYTHDGTDTTSDSFSYEATDGQGGTDTALVNLTISLNPQDNHTPVLSDGGMEPGSGNTTDVFTFTIHYRDSDGHPPGVKNVIINGISHPMTLSQGTPYNGTYAYESRLPAGQVDYSFSFTDGYGGSARLPETGSIVGPTISQANRSPVASDDTASVVRGGRVDALVGGASSVLDNDSDPDGDPLTIITRTNPAYGSLVLNSDGTFAYTHDGTNTTSDSFTYEVSDNRGRTDSAVVTISISVDPEDNTAPVLAQPGVTPEIGEAEQLFTYSVHYADEDGHGASQRLVYIDGISYTMTLTSGSAYDGTYTYQTTLDVGPHEYSFSFDDGYGGSALLPASGTFTGPTVRPENQIPVASDDAASVVRGGRVAVLNTGYSSVLDNDSDPDSDPLSVNPIPVVAPAYGILVLNTDGTFAYTHDGSETTIDSFIYEISDGWGGSDTAVVGITISLDPDDNNAPVLSSGGVTPETADTEQVFTYSVEYFDQDGHAASQRNVVIDGTPYAMTLAAGTLYDGTYTYETTLPIGDHEYVFSFDDGYGESARLPAADSYSGPSVTRVNHAPVASDDAASTVRGGRVEVLNSGFASVLDNDTDEDGDTLTVNTSPVMSPAHGSLVLRADGTFVYTHDGTDTISDSFTYEISDGYGGSDTAVVGISISLNPDDNHDPVLSGGTVTPETGDAAQIYTYSVHYADEDGHAPAQRTVVIDGTPYTLSLASGTAFDGTYTHQMTLGPGSHEFSFSFTDGFGGSALIPESGTFIGPVVTDLAERYYVATWGDDDANDGTREFPFATISRAIEAAQGSSGTPETIYIATGTYQETLVLDSWETLIGGWNSDFSQRWDFVNDGPTPTGEFETIIDGGGIDRCVVMDNLEGAVFDGITIQNGRVTSSGTGGGAFFISYSSPLITNCFVANNSVSTHAGFGGAMYIDHSSPTIRNCLISDNSATGTENRYGGAIFNYLSTPVIEQCTFIGNHAGCMTAAGGAIYNYASSAEITSCIFSENSTGGDYSYGAAIYNYACTPVITNCVFTLNSSSGSYRARGGAIYNQSSSSVITNCSFSLNEAVTSSADCRGGGIYNSSTSAPVITNTILWGDTALTGTEIYNETGAACTVTYSDVDQSPYGEDAAHNNIRQDPLFLSPAAGDLHLQAGSPCIDAGTAAAPSLPENDFEGNPRLIDESVDMGADEYCQP